MYLTNDFTSIPASNCRTVPTTGLLGKTSYSGTLDHCDRVPTMRTVGQGTWSAPTDTVHTQYLSCDRKNAFFLILTYFYLLTACVEGYCCTWPHSRAHTRKHAHTHTKSRRRTPLDEEKQTSMYSVGFEPAIPASEQPQTNALHRAATGIGTCLLVKYKRDKMS